ncbi:hypothetical protein ACVINW_003749 [Bradyrhizobium sp. USDA 4461]
MEWLMDLRVSPAISFRQSQVTRHERAHLLIAIRRTKVTVAVDNERAMGLQEERCLQLVRKMTRHVLSADVVGDVPAEVGRRQAQVFELLLDYRTRMLAGQDKAGSVVDIDYLDRPRVGWREHAAVEIWHTATC